MRDYDLLKRVGEGGMSTVWKARERATGRIVAVKLLRRGPKVNPEDIRALKTEEQMMEEVTHPGVVHAWRFGFEGDDWFMVMEYVDGYSFADYLKRHRVKEVDALLICESVAEALDYAWNEHGIVHCDIKPENIMVNNEGVVKLTDLGISYRFQDLAAGTKEIPAQVTGTPAYISPEQIYGDVELDCRADIYSLGATLYRLVTGSFLYPETDGVEELLRAQCDPARQSPDPRAFSPNLSEGFVQMLEAMLVKDRDGRVTDWPSVREMCAQVYRGGAFKPRVSDYISAIRLF